MTTTTWFFVIGHKGGRQLMAAFPNRELAEAYSENTEWTIEPLVIDIFSNLERTFGVR